MHQHNYTTHFYAIVKKDAVVAKICKYAPSVLLCSPKASQPLSGCQGHLNFPLIWFKITFGAKMFHTLLSVSILAKNEIPGSWYLVSIPPGKSQTAEKEKS